MCLKWRVAQKDVEVGELMLCVMGVKAKALMYLRAIDSTHEA